MGLKTSKDCEHGICRCFNSVYHPMLQHAARVFDVEGRNCSVLHFLAYWLSNCPNLIALHLIEFFAVEYLCNHKCTSHHLCYAQLSRSSLLEGRMLYLSSAASYNIPPAPLVGDVSINPLPNR